jgi:hypothetical protein
MENISKETNSSSGHYLAFGWGSYIIIGRSEHSDVMKTILALYSGGVNFEFRPGTKYPD